MYRIEEGIDDAGQWSFFFSQACATQEEISPATNCRWRGDA